VPVGAVSRLVLLMIGVAGVLALVGAVAEGGNAAASPGLVRLVSPGALLTVSEVVSGESKLRDATSATAYC
jgi:hypothetical protein